MLTMEQILAIAEAHATRRPATSPTHARHRVRLEAARRIEHGPRYVEVLFEAPSRLMPSHRHPAQYITMGIAGAVEPRYLVLANAPSEPVWRCLISKDSTLGSAICDFQGSDEAFGDMLLVSEAEGSGFAVMRAVEQEAPLVLLTTGSGVATMHSVLRWLEIEHPHTLSSTSIFYGEQNEQALAYAKDLTRFAQRGVEVTMAYEAPLQEDYPWQYVQQPLLQTADEVLFDEGVFLLSGAKPMLRFATHALLERGVDEDRILLNV